MTVDNRDQIFVVFVSTWLSSFTAQWGKERLRPTYATNIPRIEPQIPRLELLTNFPKILWQIPRSGNTAAPHPRRPILTLACGALTLAGRSPGAASYPRRGGPPVPTQRMAEGGGRMKLFRLQDRYWGHLCACDAEFSPLPLGSGDWLRETTN